MSDPYTVSIISDDNVVSTITVPGGELLENPPEYSSQWLANNKVSKPPHLTRNPFEVSIIKADFSVSTVTLPGGSLENPPEYPSQWFANNKGSKPPLYIIKQPDSKVVWNKKIGAMFVGNIKAEVAVRFMYDYVIEKYSGALSADWRSYGVEIGSNKAIVTPFCMVDVKEKDPTRTFAEGKILTSGERDRLFYILLAGYRYGQSIEVKQSSYSKNILREINQVLLANPFNLTTRLEASDFTQIRSWYTNPEYCVLIAALDMFWVRFSDLESSKLRVCTLNARFKDCNSISDLNHLSSLSGKPPKNILNYVFLTEVRDELIAISKIGEEFQYKYSYFPYMRELRLSRKSPYSSTANPHLHHWVGMFGALLGNERSYNARIVSEKGLHHCLNQTLFAAYAFKKEGRAQMVSKKATEADMGRGIKGEERGEAEKGVVDPPSPVEVYSYIKRNKNAVPREISTFFYNHIMKMPTPRDKTIGKFLRMFIHKYP